MILTLYSFKDLQQSLFWKNESLSYQKKISSKCFLEVLDLAELYQLLKARLEWVKSVSNFLQLRPFKWKNWWLDFGILWSRQRWLSQWMRRNHPLRHPSWLHQWLGWEKTVQPDAWPEMRLRFGQIGSLIDVIWYKY